MVLASMKLTDATKGLKQTDLEKVRLRGESLQQHSEFWDESARTDTVRAIADSDDEVSFQTSGRDEADAVLALAPENASILEVGCGPGRILRHVAPHAAEVHGVDISREMIERGSADLADLPNVHWHLGNGYDLGMFADGTFDVAYSWVTFQHMPKTIAYNYLTEVRRVLKPGGRFRLQVPNILRQDQFNAFRHFTQPFFVEHPFPMNFYTPMEIAKLLREAGLATENVDDQMVVVARRLLPDEAAAPDGLEQRLRLPEFEPARLRIEELETTLAQTQHELEQTQLELEQTRRELDHARSDVAVMRRVYLHPAVRVARSVVRGARTVKNGVRRP